MKRGLHLHGCSASRSGHVWMSRSTGAAGRNTVCTTDCRCSDPGGTSASHAQHGLSWLNFFVAAIQAGFGAFVPAYLAAQAWSQVEIGAALSVDTLASMFAQVPAGALVDAIHRRRTLLGSAIMLITVAALTLAVVPIRVPAVLALVLHSLASSVIGPAIAAVSLVLAGQCGLGERVGRNAQFAAIGGVVGAALMGAVGTLLSDRAGVPAHRSACSAGALRGPSVQAGRGGDPSGCRGVPARAPITACSAAGVAARPAPRGLRELCLPIPFSRTQPLYRPRLKGRQARLPRSPRE